MKTESCSGPKTKHLPHFALKRGNFSSEEVLLEEAKKVKATELFMELAEGPYGMPGDFSPRVSYLPVLRFLRSSLFVKKMLNSLFKSVCSRPCVS